MANLSKNFLYNIILKISGYIFPLITYPYVTRVLGPEYLGAANLVLSVVDYAVLFSTLGISTLGIREIAKCGENNIKLNQTFSRLVSLHILLTGIIALLYCIAVLSVPVLRADTRLYSIGLCKLAFNVLLVEWLYTGLQKFRYITFRTIATRVIYVILIFSLVHSQEDYWLYVAVVVAQVIINALVNWRYTRNFVRFKFDFSGVKEYFKPVLSLGVNMILFSFYGSFITLYLGFVCSNEAVGYFSTSTKIYSIVLSAVSAFNGVLLPHVNSLYGNGQIAEIKATIEKALNLVLCLSIPLVAFFFVEAADLIRLFAGPGYERSIVPFQIIIIQVVLIGLSQITELQVLLTFNKLKEILYITISTSIFSVIIMIFYASKFAEIAAAYAVLIPHILECVALFIVAKKCLPFNISQKSVLTYIAASLLVIGICYFLRIFISSMILRIVLSAFLSVLLYFSVLYLRRDPILVFLRSKILSIVK